MLFRKHHAFSGSPIARRHSSTVLIPPPTKGFDRRANYRLGSYKDVIPRSENATVGPWLITALPNAGVMQ